MNSNEERPGFNLRSEGWTESAQVPSISLLVQEKEFERLKNRKKHSVIRGRDFLSIKKMISKYKNFSEFIRKSCRISHSSFRRIVKGKEKGYFERLEEEKEAVKKGKLDRRGKQIVKQLIVPPKPPLTIRKIHDQFTNLAGYEWSQYQLRKFLKLECGFSFRTSWPRIRKTHTKRSRIIKTLFWTEMLDLLYSNYTIYNIDESSFDRSLHKKYTWVPKRGNKIMLSDYPKGKWNLVLAAGSDGNWFSFITSGTMNSQEFWIFLKLFEWTLNQSQLHESESTVFLMDNAKTHTSNLMKRIRQGMAQRILFNPPNCPETAPIEAVFGALKSKMKSQWEYGTLNFDKKSGWVK